MTIELTEEEVREIYKALGFFDAALQTNTIDSVKAVGLTYVNHITIILNNALTDE